MEDQGLLLTLALATFGVVIAFLVFSWTRARNDKKSDGPKSAMARNREK